MNKQQIISWLPMVGSKASKDQNRTGWVIAPCPMKWRHNGQDKNPSFAVKIEPGDSFTNCFSCGWHGSQSQLTFEIAHLNKANPYGPLELGKSMALIELAEQFIELDLDTPDIEQVLFGEKVRPHEFPEEWKDSFAEAWNVSAARNYLLGRGVPEEISNALDLRYDANQKRVCFPVRNFSGVLMGLHGRAIDPEDPLRYRMYNHKTHNNPLIWLGEHWVNPEIPVVFVEGPFDVTSVMRVYRNVVSPLFANPSFEKLKRMQDCLEIVTLFDNGVGGDGGRKRVSQAFTSHIITHLLPAAGKDPGSMLVGELIQLLQPHVTLDKILLA